MSTKKLIEHVAATQGVTQTVAKNMVAAVSTSIGMLLANKEEIVLPNIGKLKPVEKAPRVGRNPKTGEVVDIPARTAVKFTALKALKDAL
jgi:nucleoid DNA-binding protein